ncbi:response regulator transcription factor [Candidatus Sumerlaeota bacterium]|nr:response regulator transcription factor [Candidatus Sumerlaeota bacterium]
MKALITEDDENILNGLKDIFESEGYDTITAMDGKTAMRLFDSQAPDFVCLDIMLPGMNGYDICREIRKRNSDVPVIFISAKSEEIDKVLGLELGADDYIMKPFGVREVVARVRAITRRCFASRKPDDVQEPFDMGDLHVHPAELRATRGEQVIDLSLRDVKVLQVLHSHPGKVCDRHMIFSYVWGVEHIPNSRTLDQHISQLRKRIEHNPKDPQIIQTVHGVGYRYDG